MKNDRNCSTCKHRHTDYKEYPCRLCLASEFLSEELFPLHHFAIIPYLDPSPEEERNIVSAACDANLNNNGEK